MTPRLNDRLLLLCELTLIAGLVIADLNGLVPLSRTPFLLAIGWLSLRLRGLRWRDVGFTRPSRRPAKAGVPLQAAMQNTAPADATGRTSRALLIGTVAGLAIELFSTFVSVPFLARLTGKPPDLSEFRPLVGNLGLMLALIAASWVLAAFGEELVHRGYLMNRVAGIGHGTPGAWLVSLVVVSAFFGSCHEAQALTGMVQEGFAGFLLGLLYLGTGRNLTVPIVAHGMSNTLAFVLIYLNRYPGV